MSVAFGTFLKELRQNRGLSLEKVARAGGIATRSVAYWESGQHSPGEAEWEHLMQALNATPEERVQAAALLTTRRGLHMTRQEAQGKETAQFGPLPDLGDLVRALRSRQGWTQAQVAAQLGVSTNTINRWEMARNLPGEENLERFCTLLNAFPAERHALRQRRLELPHWKTELSWNNCMELFERVVSTNTIEEDPLAELTFLALKRQIYFYLGRMPEARLRFAMLDGYHAALLHQQERDPESHVLVRRSLKMLPPAFPGDPLHFGVLNLAAVHANGREGARRGGHEGGLTLYSRWLPRLRGIQRLVPLCDMALFNAWDKHFVETDALLAQARVILESDRAATQYHQGYYADAYAQVLRASGKPSEAMSLLPSIVDEANAPCGRMMTWASIFIEAGDRTMATRYLNQAAHQLSVSPNRRDQNRWNTITRRL